MRIFSITSGQRWTEEANVGTIALQASRSWRADRSEPRESVRTDRVERDPVDSDRQFDSSASRWPEGVDRQRSPGSGTGRGGGTLMHRPDPRADLMTIDFGFSLTLDSDYLHS